jgi:hypothetical protein
MLEQYDLIHNTEWSTLVLLDACRFDYFKRQNRIPGELREIKSRAYHTWNWLQDNFPDKYDWTYFSGHPYVDGATRSQKWNGNLHFKTVIPIWRFAWNDRLGTVHPESVAAVVKNIKYDKAIVHFIQPHGPWIGKTKWLNPWTLSEYTQHQIMGDWKAIFAKPDPVFFRRCYKDNLELVLNTVEKLLLSLKPPVIVTADHGEMLGEKGLYLHGAVEKSKAHIPYPAWAQEFLKRVPWLEVA